MEGLIIIGCVVLFGVLYYLGYRLFCKKEHISNTCSLYISSLNNKNNEQLIVEREKTIEEFEKENEQLEKELYTLMSERTKAESLIFKNVFNFEPNGIITSIK